MSFVEKINKDPLINTEYTVKLQKGKENLKFRLSGDKLPPSKNCKISLSYNEKQQLVKWIPVTENKSF